MTPAQVGQARAALGLANGRTHTLWNHRVLKPTNPVWPIWQGMRDEGLAGCEPFGNWTPDLYLFRLTLATARAVLLPGETLCEDVRFAP